MAYLVSHIAICLVFAQLLGLLLGWLLWGHAARQRGKEVHTLRERLADLHFMSGARMAMASEPQLALRSAPDALTGAVPGALSSVELPERPSVRRAFFEDEAEPPAAIAPRVPAILNPVSANPPPIAPDLEAEVKESKIQHLQQQVRDLESFRERMPLLQAQLSEAITARKASEARFQEATNDFEMRSASLLAQIREFENAAGEWEQIGEQFEREKLSQRKELEAVKATLRDLQNSQRPQAVDAAPAASAVELADLRQRYQKAVREREAAAAELELLKQAGNGHSGDSGRLAALEEAVRNRDSQLSEQAARVESLLWRVAELEPFAAEAPHKEESLRRQESEISGHMAMHAENAERIRSLQGRVQELESTTIPSDELQRIVAEHQVAMEGLAADHQQRLAEMQQSVVMKDDEIAEHVSERYGQVSLLEGMQSRIAELEAAAQRVELLEQSLNERDVNHQSALQASLKENDQRASEFQQALRERDNEHHATIQVLLNDHQSHVSELRAEWQQQLAVKDGEISERVAAAAGQARLLDTVQMRLLELEAAAQQVPLLEQSLSQRDNEIRALLAAHGETQRDVEGARSEAAQWKARTAEIEAEMAGQTTELQRLKDQNSDKEGQLTILSERLEALSSRLAAHQQRLLELEPLAARTPEIERKLVEHEQQSREQIKALADRHHGELTRLKVNSAQRIRRFRQSINSFKI